MKIIELTNDIYNEFTKKYPLSSVYQQVEYAFIMSKENYDSVILGLIDENNNVLAASVILIDKENKYKKAYAPCGFLIDYQDSNLLSIFTKEIKKYLNKMGIISIKITPLIVKSSYDLRNNIITKNNYYDIIFKNLKTLGYNHQGYNSYFEGLTPRFVSLLNIEKPYYMIFNNFNKEFRTKIRSASKKGVHVYLGTDSDLNYLYNETKKKNGNELKYYENVYKYFKINKNAEFFYTKLNPNEYLAYIQNEYELQRRKVINILNEMNNSSDRTHLINLKIQEDKILNDKKRELEKASSLVLKYPNGVVTSSILVIKGSKEVTIFMDGYDPSFKEFNSKHLLIWKLCEKYSNEGYKILNMGAITSPTLKENKYIGLNNFKLGFGSTAIEYIGELELIINHPLYLLSKTKKGN